MSGRRRATATDVRRALRLRESGWKVIDTVAPIARLLEATT